MSGIELTFFSTTMWMDVFGSISLCRTPRFIEIYRTLFQPGALDSMTAASVSVESRMESVMGCPNEVILAFAEIADLEAKKEALVSSFKAMPPSQSQESWYLPGMPPVTPLKLWQNDMATLEAKGRQIERYIPEALGPAALPFSRFQEIHSSPPSSSQRQSQAASSSSQQIQNQNLEFSGIDLNLFGGGPDPLAWFDPNDPSNMMSGAGVEDRNTGYILPDEDIRNKIAEVFRNAARVYLHSVISGCDPLIPTTRRAVQATIRALQVSKAFHFPRLLHVPARKLPS